MLSLVEEELVSLKTILIHFKNCQETFELIMLT